MCCAVKVLPPETPERLTATKDMSLRVVTLGWTLWVEECVEYVSESAIKCIVAKINRPPSPVSPAWTLVKSQVRVAGSGAMGIAPGFGGDWDVHRRLCV